MLAAGLLPLPFLGNASGSMLTVPVASCRAPAGAAASLFELNGVPATSGFWTDDTTAARGGRVLATVKSENDRSISGTVGKNVPSRGTVSACRLRCEKKLHCYSF